MNNANVGNQGATDPKIDPTEGVYQPSSVAGSSSSYYTSSLARSEQEKVRVQFIAGIPLLELPHQGSNSLDVSMSQISLDVLKAWSDSLEEEAEIVRQLINSPEYLQKEDEKLKVASGAEKGRGDVVIGQNGDLNLAEKYAWLQAFSSLLTAAIQLNDGTSASGVKGVEGVAGVQGATGTMSTQEGVAVIDSRGNIVGIREFDPTVKQQEKLPNTDVDVGEVEYAAGLSRGKSSGTAQFLAQSLLIATSEIVFVQAGLPVATVAAANTMHAEAIIFKEAWDAISQNTSNYATLVAGWVASLWGVGLIYQVSADKVKKFGFDKDATHASDIDFAKTYAEKMLGLIGSADFDASFKTAMAKSPDGTSLGLNSQSLITKAKLVLLSLVLALVAKLEVGGPDNEGWINELDFAGLLNGKTDVSKSDVHHTASIKRALIDEIKVLLGALDPSERDSVLIGLLAYMSTNPAVEEMLDQQKAFKKIMKQPSFESSVVDQSPV